MVDGKDYDNSQEELGALGRLHPPEKDSALSESRNKAGRLPKKRVSTIKKPVVNTKKGEGNP
ncbi:hypothetical protein ACFLZG_04500 [Thermodesulfobacteriota bacterium]